MDVTRLLKLMTIIIANGIVNVHSYNMSPLSTTKDKWSRANVLQQVSNCYVALIMLLGLNFNEKVRKTYQYALKTYSYFRYINLIRLLI